MDFLNFIPSHKAILLDGAMGTELDKRGLMSRGRNNIHAPEAGATHQNNVGAILD